MEIYGSVSEAGELGHNVNEKSVAHQRSSMIGFLIFKIKRCPKIRSSSPIFLPRNLQETTSKEN